MGFKKGEIYLVNFNPSKGTEAGKIRPALVIQSNLLNDINHPSTMVIPLTTNLIKNAEPLRFRVTKRDKLKSDSDLMIEQIRTVDNKRFTSERLTILTDIELLKVNELIKIVIDL